MLHPRLPRATPLFGALPICPHHDLGLAGNVHHESRHLVSGYRPPTGPLTRFTSVACPHVGCEFKADLTCREMGVYHCAAGHACELKGLTMDDKGRLAATVHEDRSERIDLVQVGDTAFEFRVMHRIDENMWGRAHTAWTPIEARDAEAAFAVIFGRLPNAHGVSA